VLADELRAASLDAAATLAELNPQAHAATKLRARENALKAIRSAIETELTIENFGGA
jgi:enoyl-CoA hydratase/carnithine racemase